MGGSKTQTHWLYNSTNENDENVFEEIQICRDSNAKGLNIWWDSNLKGFKWEMGGSKTQTHRRYYSTNENALKRIQI